MRYIGLSSFLNDVRYPNDLKQSLMNRIRIERPDLYKKLEEQESTIIQQMQQQQSQQQDEQQPSEQQAQPQGEQK
jgi:proteasome assembly chaperone (PAC2) family protein